MSSFFSLKKTWSYINIYKTLFKNFSYLTILEVLNVLFPFITYPYLIRVLGPELFGLTAYARAIVVYFSIIINFGFDISATKSVSIYRDDKKKLSEIVSSVYILKTILFVLSFICFFSIINLFGNLSKERVLYLFTFGICFYQLLFPHYFYVGIEKMKYITYLTVLSNALFTLLVFIVVKSKDDYYYIPLLTMIGYLVTGIVSIIILFKKEGLKFYFPSFGILKGYFKESLPLFASRVSAKIYTNLTAVFIGSTLSMSAVAFYDLANKVTTIAKMPISILSTTVYPHISRNRNVNFVIKLRNIIVTSMVFLYLLVVVFSNLIVNTLGGPDMSDSIPVLIILCSSIIPISLSNIYGIQMLAAFGYANTMAKAMIVTSILYLLFAGIIFLTGITNLYSFTVLAVLVEVLLAILEYIYCKEKRLI